MLVWEKVEGQIARQADELFICKSPKEITKSILVVSVQEY